LAGVRSSVKPSEKRQNMKRGQSLLATVSSTAPFVGLLGTVMGIVNLVFSKWRRQGRAAWLRSPPGISEALVTTAFRPLGRDPGK